MAKKLTKTKKKASLKTAAKKVAGKKTVAKKPAAKKAAAKKVAPKRKTAKAASAPKPAAKGHALMSVSPGFTASDAEASIKWYCDVLGFKLKERWENEGQFLGGQIASGDVTINIGQDDWKMGRDRVKGQGTRMYIMTGPDIDQFAAAIKARGGTLAHEPQDGWGMRTFSIDDPDGFKLTFMTSQKK